MEFKTRCSEELEHKNLIEKLEDFIYKLFENYEII